MNPYHRFYHLKFKDQQDWKVEWFNDLSNITWHSKCWSQTSNQVFPPMVHPPVKHGCWSWARWAGSFGWQCLYPRQHQQTKPCTCQIQSRAGHPVGWTTEGLEGQLGKGKNLNLEGDPGRISTQRAGYRKFSSGSTALEESREGAGNNSSTREEQAWRPLLSQKETDSQQCSDCLNPCRSHTHMHPGLPLH